MSVTAAVTWAFTTVTNQITTRMSWGHCQALYRLCIVDLIAVITFARGRIVTRNNWGGVIDLEVCTEFGFIFLQFTLL